MSSTLKKILPIVLIAGAALAFIIVAKPTPAPAQIGGDSGALVAETAGYDFGPLPLRSGLAQTSYFVRNTGAEPLVVNDVWTSCMCTTAVIRKGTETWGPFGMPGHGLRRGINLSLAPGEDAEVAVVFDPAAHGPAGVGPVTRSIFLSSTAGDPLELAFTATVTP